MDASLDLIELTIQTEYTGKDVNDLRRLSIEQGYKMEIYFDVS